MYKFDPWASTELRQRKGEILRLGQYSGLEHGIGDFATAACENCWKEFPRSGIYVLYNNDLRSASRVR